MEARTIQQRLGDMITAIRNITPEDLYLAKIAVNNWDKEMKRNMIDGEKKFNAFKNALPERVKKAYLLIEGIDTEIRDNIFEEKKSEGKKENELRDISTEEIQAKWHKILNPATAYDLVPMSALRDNNITKAQKGKIYLSEDGRYVLIDPEGKPVEGKLDTNQFDLTHLNEKLNTQSGDLEIKMQLQNAILTVTSERGHTVKEGPCITLGPKDLDDVYAKLRYLFDNTLQICFTEQKSDEDLTMKKVGIGKHIHEYLNQALNFDKVFNTQLDEKHLNERIAIRQKIKAIEKQFDDKEITLVQKMSQISLLSKAEGALIKLADKPYDDSVDRLHAEVESIGKEIDDELERGFGNGIKNILKQFVDNVEIRKLIPIIGERKNDFQAIKNYLRGEHITAQGAYNVLEKLNNTAYEKMHGTKHRIGINLGEDELNLICSQALMDIIATDPSVSSQVNILAKTSIGDFFRRNKGSTRTEERQDQVYPTNPNEKKK